MKMEDMSRR